MVTTPVVHPGTGRSSSWENSTAWEPVRCRKISWADSRLCLGYWGAWQTGFQYNRGSQREEDIDSEYVVSLDELRSGDYDNLDDVLTKLENERRNHLEQIQLLEDYIESQIGRYETPIGHLIDEISKIESNNSVNSLDRAEIRRYEENTEKQKSLLLKHKQVLD